MSKIDNHCCRGVHDLSEETDGRQIKEWLYGAVSGGVGVTNKKAGQRQRMMEMVLENVVQEYFYEEAMRE